MCCWKKSCINVLFHKDEDRKKDMSQQEKYEKVDKRLLRDGLIGKYKKPIRNLRNL